MRDSEMTLPGVGGTGSRTRQTLRLHLGFETGGVTKDENQKGLSVNEVTSELERDS